MEGIKLKQKFSIFVIYTLEKLLQIFIVFYLPFSMININSNHQLTLQIQISETNDCNISSSIET